jgi:hypothetical protein
MSDIEGKAARVAASEADAERVSKRLVTLASSVADR